MKVADHWLVIWMERDNTAPLSIEMHDSEPTYAAAIWDHIAEASIHVPTGNLQIDTGTLGLITKFAIEPGWYRIRSFHANLKANGANQKYKIVVWPAPSSDLKVIKQFAESW
jgi:hypothetical protein